MSKGVTLIETLIGLTILSFGILSILTSFPMGVRILDSTQRSNTALFLASGEMEELISRRYDQVELGSSLRDFDDLEGFENYRIEVEVTCFQGGDCEARGMKKVSVTVIPKLSQGREVELKTIITNK